MHATADWPWLGLLALGAVHGINPGMGWLFAVALGMQERKRRAVWRALLPLAAGHAAAVGAAVAAAGLLGAVIPPRQLRWLVAAALCGYGLLQLAGARHPRLAGMRVGFRDLTLWSFLMATAHGAGLMVVPLVLDAAPGRAAAHGAAHVGHHAAIVGGQGAELAVALAHTAGYLLVTGLVAAVVYEKLGLRLLGRVWVNLDVVWAVALVVTGVVTAVV